MTKDNAQLIADLIPSLTHDELTALSYLMFVRKNEIEEELRNRLTRKAS